MSASTDYLELASAEHEAASAAIEKWISSRERLERFRDAMHPNSPRPDGVVETMSGGRQKAHEAFLETLVDQVIFDARAACLAIGVARRANVAATKGEDK